MKREMILILLLGSIFWPFSYAQPSPKSGPEFCDLGQLKAVNLDYDQVTAIQGIVTQDVLTSADNYKALKASRELGAEQKTPQARIADKYRLYFVGPDGQIKYSDIISNRFTSAQEWLLNTTIFGRVEYGGKMGEDLLVCPDLPTSEKGMCNYKAGDQVQDVYSKDWSVGVQTPAGTAGQAYFTSVSNFVQLATDSGDPFGTVDLGMSRIRSHKYIVSLAAPAGSQLFIIPKTYMYFMSQLKNIAQFEAVAQIAFMAGGIVNVFRGFRKSSEFMTNKERVLQAPRDRFRRIGKKLKNFISGKSDDIEDVTVPLRETREITDSAISANRRELIKILEENANDEKIGKLVNGLPDDIKTYIEGLDDDSKKRFFAALVSGDEESVISILKRQGSPVAEGQARSLVKEWFGEYEEIVPNLGEESEIRKSIEENIKNILEGEKAKSRLSNLISKTEEISKIEDKEKQLNELRRLRAEYADDLDYVSQLLGKESLAYDKALVGKGTPLITKLGIYGEPEKEEVAKNFGELLSKSQPKTTFGKWFVGKLGLTPHEYIPIVLKARTIGVAGTFLRSYLKGLYYVGRPITALAWGLQTASILFAMNGYLELSPPGITLEWDPQTTGDLFTKQSYILIKGTPSSVPGMYSAGAFGSLGAKDFASFLLSLGIDPVLSGKYSNFGDYLIFGYDFNPNAYEKIIKVEKEGQPTGITQITRAGTGYLMRMANWKQTGISVLEDPTTMKQVGNESLLTSVGVTTSGADIYAYIYGNPDRIKSQFPITWTLAEKLGDFGFLSQAVTSASIIYLWPTVPRLRGVIGATLITGLSKSLSSGARQLVVAKTTDMKSLEKCVSTGECERPSCEQVCARCQAELGVMSGYLVTSGIAQTVLDYSGVLAPVSFALGTVDMIVLEGGIPLPGGGIKFFEGKLEKTDRCLHELLTCNERNFIIVAGQTIKSPDVIKAEQEQARSLKGLPGLDKIPVEKLLGGFSNITGPINLDQEQLNVHGEFYNVTGRIAFRDIYYLHIIDATIDFLANSFPFHMCGLTENETLQECVDIQGDTLKYGNTTIKSPLVPFKWLDTEMPAMIIPNTAIFMNISDSNCAVFSVSPQSLEPNFNPQITQEFERQNFSELERTFGNLRVINLDEGSIYPVTNIDGKTRLELDLNDGGYEETDNTVWLTRSGKVVFKNLKGEEKELGFRSAVFSGGIVLKKGNAIYILPRYFKPSISGIQWRQIVGTKPFKSLNGQSPAAVDELGNILGINAKNTKIPGADKLGIITAVSGYKDLNGDGKIEDNEKVGWRFYKKGNKTYFDLYYNGKKETYDGSQVEIEPDGTIKVYEKGKPHTDAYLLREISTKVDELGRTLMTVKDGKGNKLVEDALLTWIKGTGGSIQYNPDTNNYVFVNGQPIELNNEFKTNGFNAITGTPDPPLLQPSSAHGEKPWEKVKPKPAVPPIVPTVPENDIPIYVLAILLGLLGIYLGKKVKMG